MRTSPFRLASIAVVAMVGFWLIFAFLVFPWIIQGVYNGSLPFLNNFLIRNRVEGQIVNSLESYQQEWGEMAREFTLQFLGFGLLTFVMVKGAETRAFFEKVVGRARPGELGAIRMWTCAILLASTFVEQLSSIALLPDEMRRPMGLMVVLDHLPLGFDRFVASGPSLWAFQWVTQILLFLAMIGCGTRVVVPLAVLCAYVFNGILREFTFFWHQNLVPIYVLAVLSFTPCDDGWSLDRLRRIYANKPVPDAEQPVPVYGWSRYACWVPIALLYCWSGLSKLRQSGLMWVNPTNIRNVMYEESLSGRWLPLGQGLTIAWAPDFVFVMLGVTAIAGELFYPTVLFSKRARRIVPLVTIGMHLGIIFLQDIVFLDLIALNLILLDFSWLRDALARRLARRGPLTILYDGSCRYCRGTVRALKAMDLFGRLETLDFRRLDLGTFNRANGSNVDAKGLEREMALVSSGNVYSGFAAYRVLSSAIPALWVLAPLFRLPGSSHVGSWVYKQVALRRYGGGRCTGACEFDPVGVSVFTASELTAVQRSGYVLGVCSLTLVMTVVFLNRIEFYPFTAMPLFTGLKTSVVTYYRVIGERESGQRSLVLLEDAIPVMSFNSRYAQVIEGCFSVPAEKEICRRFLTASLAAYNEKSPEQDRLTGYEVEKKIWDFHLSPDDPMYGRTTDRFAVTLDE